MTSPETAAIRPETTRHGGASRRILGMVLRHYYLLRGSIPRLVEWFYWPMLNILMWGYLNKFLYLSRATPLLTFGILLGGAMLWEIVIRGQMGAMKVTFEEMWSRNLTQLFVSPLSPSEFLVSLVVISFLSTTVALIPCTIAASWVFGFSIFDLGWQLGAFYFMQLMTGWWMAALMAALLVRYGLGMEWIVWMSIWILAPITGCYYPVTVLPEWLQHISWLLPPTYIFEGMRQILNHQTFDAMLLLKSLGLNILYLAGSCGIFLYAFDAARRHGSLLQAGE
ncbi:MAG: ABC transporter permease [Alphaproteobacteria bacterium]